MNTVLVLLCGCPLSRTHRKVVCNAYSRNHARSYAAGGRHAGTEREKAIALHDHVRDSVKFGFTRYCDATRPDYTLARAVGHCNPKSRLMVAFLRDIGLAAPTSVTRTTGTRGLGSRSTRCSASVPEGRSIRTSGAYAHRSRRHQALHDIVTNASVRIRDVTKAQPYQLCHWSC